MTLVLLPGLDGTEIFFRPFVEALPEWVEPRVITYPTASANSYSDLTLVIQKAVASCEDFYVLGWSFSGPLALRLVAKEQTKVRGVILCASFIRPPHRGLPLLRFAISAPTVHLVRLVHRVAISCSSAWTDMLRRDKSTTWARVPNRVIALRVREILTLDERDSLRTCPRPVLYLAGSKDWVVPSRNAEEVVRELPLTKVVTIEGSHLALYTNPAAAVQAVVRFMIDTAANCQNPVVTPK